MLKQIDSAEAKTGIFNETQYKFQWTLKFKHLKYFPQRLINLMSLLLYLCFTRFATCFRIFSAAYNFKTYTARNIQLLTQSFIFLFLWMINDFDNFAFHMYLLYLNTFTKQFERKLMVPSHEASDVYQMSHDIRKPVYAIDEQQRRRSACASTQSDQHLCCSLPR